MPKPQTEVLVACDGSCLKNPGGATGWAWVTSDGRWSSSGQPTGTNQVAELWGVISVLRDFPDVALIIQIDSEYAMKAATVWSKAWKRNGWKKADGSPVSNVALVKTIDRLMSLREHPVRFEKVPGHDPQNRYALNTAADKRARAAAEFAREHEESRMFRGMDRKVAALPRSAWRPEGVSAPSGAGKAPRRTPEVGGANARPSVGGERSLVRPGKVNQSKFCPSCGGPITATGECLCSL